MKSLAIKGILGAAAVAGAVGVAQVGSSASSGPGFSAAARPQAVAQTAANGQANAELNAELSGKVATKAPSKAPTKAPTKARGILRRVEHGQFTVATKQGDKTYDIQLGQVSSVDATTITVTSHDGFVETYAVTASTKVRFGTRPSSIASVQVGDRVRVLGSGGDALRVRETAADAAAPASAASPA
jgi:hypothetical protein